MKSIFSECQDRFVTLSFWTVYTPLSGKGCLLFLQEVLRLLFILLIDLTEQEHKQGERRKQAAH